MPIEADLREFALVVSHPHALLAPAVRCAKHLRGLAAPGSQAPLQSAQESRPPMSHAPTSTVGSLVYTASEASLSVSGPSQSPADLHSRPPELSRETPRLWRRAGRGARSDRHRAEPRVFTGQNAESPGGVTTEALC
jgi:hypothetical protein